MKKYLLFLIAILSVTLSSCSVDDDYCGNGFYRAKQLSRKGNFYPNQLVVKDLKGELFTVIRSDAEFQRRVNGAHYYGGEDINFREEELIIGETTIDNFTSIIDMIPMYKESCNTKGDNILEVDIIVNRGYKNAWVTFHAIVPKTKSNYYAVRTFTRYK